MTGYAALEYGFPSTHSANAVSVAAYALLLLRDPENTLSEGTKTGLEYLAYFYAFSIVIGRLYCGMHGFLDVIFGSILGLFIGVVEFYYGPELDLYMYNSSWFAPLIATLIIIALVRIHPEPADDCPCFDDSVAFAGVVIGLECGTWTYGRTAWDPFIGHAHGLQSMDVTKLSWYILLARLVIGVAIIFVWREVTKPALLKFLPHIFRVITRAGWILPRRFFKPASQYQTVSPKLRLDNVFPAVSDLPRVVESMRHPNSRGRSVSVGPQSAADAYETLAYRERRRRESIGSNGSLRSKSSLTDLKEKSGGHEEANKAHETRQSLLKQYESMMGEGEVLVSRTGENGKVDVYAARGDGLDETEMFSRLVRPRVRYDVEVVTKLVVYAGKKDFSDLHCGRLKLTVTAPRHRLVKHVDYTCDPRAHRLGREPPSLKAPILRQLSSLPLLAAFLLAISFSAHIYFPSSTSSSFSSSSLSSSNDQDLQGVYMETTF